MEFLGFGNCRSSDGQYPYWYYTWGLTEIACRQRCWDTAPTCLGFDYTTSSARCLLYARFLTLGDVLVGWTAREKSSGWEDWKSLSVNSGNNDGRSCYIIKCDIIVFSSGFVLECYDFVTGILTQNKSTALWENTH